MTRSQIPATKPPRISDVAARAGVSLSTVSRVLNGSTTVDSAMADRVHEAALALGYAASPLARSLVLGATQTIAVVVPDLGNPVFQAVLRGLTSTASRAGYHVLVADSFESADEEPELAMAARRRCDGIVLCAPRMSDETLARLLPALRPAVLVNRSSDAAPSVSVDYRSGILQLLAHLTELGHRTISYVSGASAAESDAARRAGIRAFVDDHPEVTVREVPGGVDFAAGHGAADGVQASEATAVLAFNDLVAMGLLSALSERGVRVPQDVSVTGFDDIPFAAYTTPPLTTASVPVEALGTQAADRLLALLAGRAPDEDVSFEPVITVRGSTGDALQR
ncbi:LacI family DNA-binding transcriptional regulator [Humibacter ginsenosidimutans]|uniref:LacI family transcriptional regulator n=1 Tax=Humibacter ginsenosidimutans TaxID=2599293 RepID=A0A5B8M6H5_9MICO|nr:LacI family DNA-binding transcriptional regulator [Humibacter ginsenosidimutans]QDZ15719.1 LacI family transcriptional regulator [Humibacter ginsenosidimutans]